MSAYRPPAWLAGGDTLKEENRQGGAPPPRAPPLMARVRARCGEGGGSSVNPVRRGRMVRSETRRGSLMGLGGVRRRSRGKSPE